MKETDTGDEAEKPRVHPDFYELQALGESFYAALAPRARAAERPAPGSLADKLKTEQEQWGTTGWEHPADDLVNFMKLYLFSAADELLHASTSATSMSLLGVDVAARASIEASAFAYDLGKPELVQTKRIARGLRHRIWAEKELVKLVLQKNDERKSDANEALDRLAKHGFGVGLLKSPEADAAAKGRTSAVDACSALFEVARQGPAREGEDRIKAGEFLYRLFSTRSHANPISLMHWASTVGPPNDEGHIRLSKEVDSTATSILWAINALTAAIVECAKFMGYGIELPERHAEMNRLLELANDDRVEPWAEPE